MRDYLDAIRSRVVVFDGGMGATLEQFELTSEDYGGLLLHLGDSARGAFTASQVAAGNKNRFAFEIYGTKSGVRTAEVCNRSPDTR